MNFKSLPSSAWLVVFCDPPPAVPSDSLSFRVLGKFMTTFFKKGFRHVFVLHPTRAGGWFILDPSSAGLIVIEADNTFLDALRVDIAAGKALVVQAHTQAAGRVLPRGLFTCVAVVKHLLGLRAWHVVTPAQLYKYLSRR